MSLPEFLVADPMRETWCSPLQEALVHAPPGITDVSAGAHDGALGPAAGIAGIELAGPFARTLLARLTDLDPPGIGVVAHIRAELTREGDDCYRIWFPQEYSEYLAHVVLDAEQGLR